MSAYGDGYNIRIKIVWVSSAGERETELDLEDLMIEMEKLRKQNSSYDNPEHIKPIVERVLKDSKKKSNKNKQNKGVKLCSRKRK